MRRTPTEVGDVTSFNGALHLCSTKEAVANHNIEKLHAIEQPVALIKAIHTGPGAGKMMQEDWSLSSV